MIKITKHTSDICGCVTWYEWDTDQDEGSRIHTDIAVSPCVIHDPVNFGKTLVVDTAPGGSQQIVRQSCFNELEVVSDIRPEKVKDVIPLSISLVPRSEMYLKQETIGVLLEVPEISEDELDDGGKPIGRKFKDEINADFSFDAQRKLIVSLEGAEASEKQVVQDAIDNSGLDTDKIIIS